MKTVALGWSGVQVSAACLGAMRFGTRTDEKTSFRILDVYTEAGGTFLDTANVYAAWEPGAKGGESESLLGRWMRDRKNRDRLFVATKVGSRFQKTGIGPTSAQIRTALDDSLRHTGIDRVDLLYAHFDDPNTPQEEVLAAFADAIQAGKVRFPGASNFRAWRLAEARVVCEKRGFPGFVCVQERYSYLQPVVGCRSGTQVAANEDVLEYCRRHNLRLLAYSPLLSGVYGRADRKVAEPYQCRVNEKRMETLRAMAQEKGVTPNQIVFAWMANSEPAVIPIIGASAEDQIRENLAAMDLALGPEDMKRLNAAA